MKNRLSDLRAERKMSQEELATKLHCTQQKISRYENWSAAKIDINLEDDICEFFDCSLDYLRCKSDVRNVRQYESIKKVAELIESFYNDFSGDKPKKEQDLSDEQLALFKEWMISVKSVFSHYADLSLGTSTVIDSSSIQDDPDKHQ